MKRMSKRLNRMKRRSDGSLDLNNLPSHSPIKKGNSKPLNFGSSSMIKSPMKTASKKSKRKIKLHKKKSKHSQPTHSLLKTPIFKKHMMTKKNEKSSMKHSPNMEHSGLKSPIMKHSGLKSPIMKHSGLKSPIMKHSGLKSPIMKNSGLKSPIMKQSPVMKNTVNKPKKINRTRAFDLW